MGGKPAFKWTADAVQTLTRLYASGQARMAIADVLGTDARVVGRKIDRLDLARKLAPEDRAARKLATARHMHAAGMAKRAVAGEYVWTPDQIDRLRRLYVVDLLSAAEIAEEIGCKPRDVSRKAFNTGLTRLRDASVRHRDRMRAQHLAVTRSAEVRAAAREAASRATAEPKTDAELIAAAIAAGKVQHIPSGHACGLTGLERYLWASGPLTGRIERKVRGKARGRAA